MLASTWSIRFFSLALVKFLSRAFTALNLLPSIAATAWLNRSSRRHRSMNLRQVARIAGPLSFLKAALGLPLQPAARGDLVDVAVDIVLEQHARMIGRAPGRLGNHPLEPKRPQVQLLDEHVDHSDRVLLRHIVVQELGKQNALPAVLAFNAALHRQLRSSVVEILAQPAFSHSLGQTRK